jgi:GH15 family glucan-1,4-alpha-glucosidase
MMMEKVLGRIELYQKSVEIILNNQDKNGGYVASPTFPTYYYSWFRDGAFIAYAMNLAGQHSSAGRFHAWAAKNILQRQDLIERAVAAAEAGQELHGIDILHTRYTLEGDEVVDPEEEWPNFQLDGFGTWIWSLNEHVERSGEKPAEEWLEAAALASEYLRALWNWPCYDCWEEFPDKIHLHTLAAIYGGLQAHSRLSGNDHGQTMGEISHLILTDGAEKGYFVKHLGTPAVDASLLGLAVPYQMVDPLHPLMQETAARIEHSLGRGGGVHRYALDTYYGGGEWILLAGWLGWYYVRAGEPERAERLLAWMEEQADADGNLPEQTAKNLIDPEYLEPWQRRWGQSASPLLWSHAMYIVLNWALEQRR